MLSYRKGNLRAEEPLYTEKQEFEPRYSTDREFHIYQRPLKAEIRLFEVGNSWEFCHKAAIATYI